MPTVTIACTADATVVQNLATKNYSQAVESVIRATSPEKSVLEYYDLRQIPAGVTVLEAKRVAYQSKLLTTGDREISMHLVAAAWLESKVTYSNQPATVGTPATADYDGVGAVNKALETDCTALVQTIVDGATYTGFKIKSDSTSEYRYWSRTGTKPPVLVVTYSTEPAKPSVLSPFDGATVLEARPTFSGDFHDTSGDDKTLHSIQLQFDDNIDFGTIAHDSGEVFTGVPQWVPDFDLVLDEPIYWRMRVRDGDLNWSKWSDPRLVTRRTAPTLEILNPGEAPADVVTEPTPPFSTELQDGYTQTAYRYRVIDLVDPLLVYWDTGKTTGTDDTVTPSTGALTLAPGARYLFEAGVWVAELSSVAGGAPHATASREFGFELGTGEEVVVDLTFTPDPSGKPTAVISWSDPAGVPDGIAVLRDGVIVFTTEDVIDLQVAPGDYEWPDHEFSTINEHVWSVARIVNGVMSDDNPTVTGSITPTGVWLSTLDGSHWVRFSGKDPIDWEANEDTDLVMPLGAKNPSLVTGNIFGRGGSLDGFAKKVKGQTHEQMVEHLTAMLDTELYPRGTPFLLTLVDTRTKVMWWNTVRSERHEYVEKIRVRAKLQELVD